VDCFCGDLSVHQTLTWDKSYVAASILNRKAVELSRRSCSSLDPAHAVNLIFLIFFRAQINRRQLKLNRHAKAILEYTYQPQPLSTNFYSNARHVYVTSKWIYSIKLEAISHCSHLYSVSYSSCYLRFCAFCSILLILLLDLLLFKHMLKPIDYPFIVINCSSNG
jgi:hypothetical protein